MNQTGKATPTLEDFTNREKKKYFLKLIIDNYKT